MSKPSRDEWMKWRSEGLAWARGAGGVELERHFRAGFDGGDEIRAMPEPPISPGSGTVVSKEWPYVGAEPYMGEPEPPR